MKKTISIICLIAMMLLLLAGCGSAKGKLDGKWAYIHDDKNPVLIISGNAATYEGEKYACTVDDSNIVLKSGDAETVIPYKADGDNILIYKTTEYKYVGEKQGDSLVGRWMANNNWEFEFTDDGTFKEDGYFPGYYSVDEQAGTFKLVYNDHFVDTVCYYSISGDTLSVQYPWTLVPVK